MESDRAKCKICDNVYSRKGRCTTGLITHLKLKHNDEYLKFINLRDKSKESVAASTSTSSLTPLQTIKKQMTLQESLHRKDYWASSHTKTMEFDKLIAEMIALQDLPFNFVESIGFRRLMQAALPRYKLRGREYFTSFLCENLYNQMASKVKQLLKGFNKLSFTSDVWSDPNAGVSLLSLTAHGITEDFRKVHIILKCEPIEGSHTGAVISEKLIMMLNEWDLATEKVHCVVRDRGSNMIRAMNLSNFTHIDCIVHQIQLCVRAGIESEDHLLKIIAKNKHIATHFNHSILAQDELYKIQTQRLNQPSLAVIQNCPTRYFFNFLNYIINIDRNNNQVYYILVLFCLSF